jgi:hypothetical protein
MTNRASNPAAVDLLEHEFAQERASALGRLGRAFEAALAALREFDLRMANPEPSPVERELRAALVEEASTALWHFVVQREACGLRNMRHLLHEYRVPVEVSCRMGIVVPSGRAISPQRRGNRAATGGQNVLTNQPPGAQEE